MALSDFLVRGILKEYNARFIFAETSALVNEGVKIHDCDPVSAFIFGEALTVGALLSPLLTGNEKYSVRWQYEGKIGSVLVDVNSECDVRGIIKETRLAGQVKEISDLYGDGGLISIVKSQDGKILNSGSSKAGLLDIANDIAFHFSTSDQIETEISSVSDFRADPANPVRIAAGFMLQAMPDADLKEFEKLRKRINSEEFKELLKTDNLQEEKKLKILLKNVLDGKDADDTFNSKSTWEFSSSPSYKCPCSEKKMKNAVMVLKKEELEEIFAKEESLRINCEFCKKLYNFHRKDIIGE